MEPVTSSRSIANVQPPPNPAGPGNRRALRHGVDSKLALAPRAAELAEWLRATAPAYAESDEPAIQAAAMVFAQVEAGNEYIAKHGWFDSRGKPRPLMKTLPTLQAEARRWSDALGLTPTARMRLGLTRARGAALTEYLEDRYGGEK